MRKSLTFLLAIVVVAFGLPIASHANSADRAGSLTGRAVDVAGRAVAGQRVELLRGTEVVDVVTTTAGGDWTFPAVVAGDYVVRMTINNTIAGVRVTVLPGQAIAGNLLVAPAATAAPQFGILAGGLGGSLSGVVTAIATAASAAGAASVNTDTVRVNPRAVEDILNGLSIDQKLTFVQSLIDALEQVEPASMAFGEAFQLDDLIFQLNQYATELQIADALGSSAPDFDFPDIVAS